MNAPSVPPIFCATDFSDAARQAADVASLLARKMQVPLVLVHGIDERGEIPPHHWPALVADAQPRLLAEVQRLQAKGGTVEPVLAGAGPDDGVVRHAEKAQARMIVVSSSGSGAAYRWLMGSVSERMAETARVPTLVVRNAAVLEAWLRHERPLRIFIGADFTAVSDIALRWVAEVATTAPCQVTVGYVDHEIEICGHGDRLSADAMRAAKLYQRLVQDLRQRVVPLFVEKTVHIRVVAAEDRVDLRLLELADDAQADLIVVGTHQWRGMERLWHHSVSREILHAAKANVACVPVRCEPTSTEGSRGETLIAPSRQPLLVASPPVHSSIPNPALL